MHCVFIHSSNHSLQAVLIRRSGAVQQTFYGSNPAYPVLEFLHHGDESPANCRFPRHNPPIACAVLQFEGGVVVISHDSQLLSRVCDDAERSEVWLVEDGEVERYDGYFEEYKAELVKEIADEMDED